MSRKSRTIRKMLMFSFWSEFKSYFLRIGPIKLMQHPPPTTTQGTIPVKTDEDDTMDHEDMEDGSSQAGIEDNDRMLMSLTPDRTVQKGINQTWHDIERKRKNRNWKDDVQSMHEAFKKEGIGNAVMEVFSQPRVNRMAERMGIMP